MSEWLRFGLTLGVGALLFWGGMEYERARGRRPREVAPRDR